MPLEETVAPFGRAWTQVCDTLIDAADLVTVSNVALQRKYGGVVVPHVRDGRVFDPGRFDRQRVRAELGVAPDQRLLLFGGTPRLHKGVREILDALDALDDPRYRLALFQTPELSEIGDLGGSERWIVPIPPQSFDRLPGIVGAADLSCVLQDPEHPVVRFQLPAKITDALAMGIPCLVRAVPPLQPLVDAGVVAVHPTDEPLHETLTRLFDDPVAFAQFAERGRRYYDEHLTFSAVTSQLSPLIEAMLAEPPPLDARLGDLVAAAAHVGCRAPGTRADDGPGPGPGPGSPSSRHSPTRRDAGRDVRPGDVLEAERHGPVRPSFRHAPRTPRAVGSLRHDRALRQVDLPAAVADDVACVVGRARPAASRRPSRPSPDCCTGETTAASSHGRFCTRRGRSVGWAYRDDRRIPTTCAECSPSTAWERAADDLLGLADESASSPPSSTHSSPTSWSPTSSTTTGPGTTPGHPKLAEIEGNYREVLERSDLVIANCEPVVASMRELGFEAHLIANGCELPDGRPRGPRPAVPRSPGRTDHRLRGEPVVTDRHRSAGSTWHIGDPTGSSC